MKTDKAFADLGNMIKAEVHRRLDRIDKRVFLAYSFAPFCIAEGAWDAADTIRDLAIQMRLTDMRPQTRMIRMMRTSYEKLRQQANIGHDVSADKCRESELNNWLSIADGDKDMMKALNDAIAKAIDEQHPGLDECHRMLLIAVYDCHFLLLTTFRLADLMAKKVAALIGMPGISNLLPNELYALDKVALQFAGDCELSIPELDPIVDGLVERISNVEFTNCVIKG